MNFSAEEMIERIKSKVPLKNLSYLDISSGTISTWKTNNRPPRSDVLYDIALYLGVSMEWLLTGKESSSDQSELIYKQKYEQLAEVIKNFAKTI